MEDNISNKLVLSDRVKMGRTTPLFFWNFLDRTISWPLRDHDILHFWPCVLPRLPVVDGFSLVPSSPSSMSPPSSSCKQKFQETFYLNLCSKHCKRSHICNFHYLLIIKKRWKLFNLINIPTSFKWQIIKALFSCNLAFH